MIATHIAIIIKRMSSQISYPILSFISPPDNSCPSGSDITTQLQSRFYQDCMCFLQRQKQFHLISKQVQNVIATSIVDSVELDQRVVDGRDKITKIDRELRKINNMAEDAKKREEFLAAVCRFVEMDQARKVIMQAKILDEGLFIKTLMDIDSLSKQIGSLQSDIKIIVQIQQQLGNLLEQISQKITKGNMPPSLLHQILKSPPLYCPFLHDKKTKNSFIINLTSQRLQKCRMTLNPLINNLNYVQNVTQLYNKIVQEWIQLIQEQLDIFYHPNADDGEVKKEEVEEKEKVEEGKKVEKEEEEEKQNLRKVVVDCMSGLVGEIVPKLERGVFKIKGVIDLVRVRVGLVRLKGEIERCGDGIWDLLSKLIIKITIILQEKLEQEAEQLQIAKYNIHSLASYIPIRQHLQTIKSAKLIDPTNKQIRWQQGFKRLADSRDPSKQSNNKSLLIFNLNIWYLYTHIMKQDGQYHSISQTILSQCTSSLITLNLTPILKSNQQPQSIQKILDLCSSHQSIKKSLQLDIQLLGHQKLRKSVEKSLAQGFVQQLYRPLLAKFLFQGGLSGDGVVEIAGKEKLNLNKYGKGSESLRILTAQQMLNLIV